MNKEFKVGDRVTSRYTISRSGNNLTYKFHAICGEGPFIITCIKGDMIGFKSEYPKGRMFQDMREGKEVSWNSWDFKLVKKDWISVKNKKTIVCKNVKDIIYAMLNIMDEFRQKGGKKLNITYNITRFISKRCSCIIGIDTCRGSRCRR